jgi:hypothetical protein
MLNNIPGHKGNANQNHTKFYCTPVRKQTRSIGKDVGKTESSYTAGGNISLYNHCGKQYGGSLKI